MTTQRPFGELNLWQRIFAGHWAAFAAGYEREHGRAVSTRRIENYDGQNLTYRYEDHLKGEMHETIPAVEFIWQMIRHLPPKGFRMVRYYGIYARPVREKIHALVASALQVLMRRAEQVAQYFARQRPGHPGQPYRQKLEERFGKGEMRCPTCGSTNMLLIRIWSKAKGVVYEVGRDGVPPARPCLGVGGPAPAQLPPRVAVSLPPIYRQLAFGI